MNKNNNLTTIYHDRHDQLKLLVGTPAKAEFLSKCIYWWQISKYKIKKSEYTWFTRTTDELANSSGLSNSSVGRYLRYFTQEGLIEKRVIKRFSRRHNQDIACLHIRITDKLLAFLKTTTKKPSTTNQTAGDDKQPDSNYLSQIDDTPSLNLTDPTINNKGDYPNNNIVNENGVNCVKNKTPSFEKTNFPIEKEIGERVSVELKDKIKGMLVNVLKKQGQKLEHNERLFTEVLFSVTNKEQFKDIACIDHRINIAASLIRKKLWRTPKGFYNHWDIGQAFKDRDEVKRRRMQDKKLERELLGVTDPKLIADIKARFEVTQEQEARFNKPKKTQQSIVKPNEKASYQQKLTEQLHEINNEIFTQGKYLEQMEEAFKEGLNYASQDLIDSIGIKLAKLYEEQGVIEKKIASLKDEYSVCA